MKVFFTFILFMLWMLPFAQAVEKDITFGGRYNFLRCKSSVSSLCKYLDGNLDCYPAYSFEQEVFLLNLKKKSICFNWPIRKDCDKLEGNISFKSFSLSDDYRLIHYDLADDEISIHIHASSPFGDSPQIKYSKTGVYTLNNDKNSFIVSYGNCVNP